MRDEHDTGEAETRVNDRAVCPETWPSEQRIHGEGYATGSADGHLRTITDTNRSNMTFYACQSPMDTSQKRLAHEGEEDRCDSCTPHQ